MNPVTWFFAFIGGCFALAVVVIVWAMVMATKMTTCPVITGF